MAAPLSFLACQANDGRTRVLAVEPNVPRSRDRPAGIGRGRSDTVFRDRPLTVELVVDTSPRAVEMPADLVAALAANAAAGSFFDTLSNSLQRYHIDNINTAKTAETRQRRVDKAISLFLVGKQR